MPGVLETRPSQRDSQAVIVGIHLRVGTVARIWILMGAACCFGVSVITRDKVGQPQAKP